MTTESTNLDLILYNNTTDQSGSFVTWTHDMSGSSVSNMTKIDDFAGVISGSVTGIGTSVSGSVTTINNTMTDISGSLITLTASLATLNLRLQKIDEFSGAGQADFDDIPQTFTHLILMGVGAIDITGSNGDYGCDFNGDANTANYASVQWQKYLTPAFESFTEYLRGEILLGNLPGNTYNATYGGSMFAIIPNYSASSGFYKSGMGLTTYSVSGTGASTTQGGVWKRTTAIERVRVFGVSSGAIRYDFKTGTKFTLYGFG